MGFGLRNLKKKQDSETEITKKQYIKNLVVGESTAAFLLLNKLHKTESSTKILTDKVLTIDSIQEDWKTSLEMIRGQEAREMFVLEFPEYVLGEERSKSVFYKDTSFKEFGGRTKPFELMKGEELFMESAQAFTKSDLFNDEALESLEKLFIENQEHKVIVEIEHIEPTDLAEPASYRLHLSDYEVIECENIYWSRSPKEFLKLSRDKDYYSNTFHEVVSKICHKSALKIRLNFEKPVSDQQMTVFLPQSITHEWGYFLCEFSEKLASGQSLNVLCYVDEDDSTSEELTKKIKLIKRVIERVYPQAKNNVSDEYIVFSKDTLALEIDDELYNSDENKLENLFFIGECAPIETRFTKASLLLRSLLSLRNT
jgi:hypothetical protein